MGNHKKFESSDDSDEEMRKAVDKKKVKDGREKNREIGPRKEKHGSESDEESREKKPRKEREEERKHKHRDEDKSREKDRQRREERSGGGGDHRRDRDDYRERRDDRRRDWNDRGGNFDRRRDNDRRRRDDGGKQWDNKLSQDEISRQRKMLWSKPNEKQEASPSNEESSKTETEAGPTDKKATQWASSIAAAGVSGVQSNKFLKLLGIKKTPQDPLSTEDLQKEKERQQKMITDLDKQYQVARESTHMGKGVGLGFH